MEYLMLLLLTLHNSVITKSLSNIEKNEGLNAAYQKHTISSQTKKNELAVKIVKKLIKKTEQDGRELWKAILD